MNAAQGINEKKQGTCHGEVFSPCDNTTTALHASPLTVITSEPLSHDISGFMKLY